MIDIKDRPRCDLDNAHDVLQRAWVCYRMSDPDLIVDARGLDPPEPLERILDALAILKKEQRVRFRIHREPFRLYHILAQNGYEWQTTHDPERGFELVIWEPQRAD